MQSRQRTRIYEIDQEQGDKILNGFIDINIRSRISKDLPIVLTALAADKRLISNNRQDRKHFQDACAWADSLSDLLWPWPLTKVPEWLFRGAPSDPKYKLCCKITENQ